VQASISLVLPFLLEAHCRFQLQRATRKSCVLSLGLTWLFQMSIYCQKITSSLSKHKLLLAIMSRALGSAGFVRRVDWGQTPSAAHSRPSLSLYEIRGFGNISRHRVARDRPQSAVIGRNMIKESAKNTT